MSPITLSRHLRHPDLSTPIHTNSSVRSPHPGFRASANKSPNFARSQRPNRAFGISSIRDLARSSRQALSTKTANITQPLPIHRLRSSSSLYGTLRDQCTPPAPDAKPSAPAVPGRYPSQSSSTNSFTPDQSGVSNDSSHPTTPSPAKHRAFDQLETSPLAQLRSMGQNPSVLKKAVSLEGKQSLATIKGETSEDWKENKWVRQKSPSSESSPATLQPPPSIRPPPVRPDIVTLNVPRRRSSLTAIHLNSLHFDSIDPNQTQLQHRASTLTEPGQRRPSTLSDTLRPVIASVGPSTPNTQIEARDALSPPLLSPSFSTSQLSPALSDAPSASSRNSVLKSHIHFPKTFPNGPAPVPAPALTIVHYECYQGHQRVLASGNVHCPAQCMTCRGNEEKKYWKCIWCGLRICGTCMKEFDRQGRDLKVLLAWVKGNEEGQKQQTKDAVESMEKKQGLDRKADFPNGDRENSMRQMDGNEQVVKGLALRKKRDTA